MPFYHLIVCELGCKKMFCRTVFNFVSSGSHATEFFCSSDFSQWMIFWCRIIWSQDCIQWSVYWTEFLEYFKRMAESIGCRFHIWGQKLRDLASYDLDNRRFSVGLESILKNQSGNVIAVVDISILILYFKQKDFHYLGWRFSSQRNNTQRF